MLSKTKTNLETEFNIRKNGTLELFVNSVDRSPFPILLSGVFSLVRLKSGYKLLTSLFSGNVRLQSFLAGLFLLCDRLRLDLMIGLKP